METIRLHMCTQILFSMVCADYRLHFTYKSARTLWNRQRKREREREMATVFPPAVTLTKITATKTNAHRKRQSIIHLCCHGIFRLSSLQSQKQKRCKYPSANLFFRVVSRPTRNKSFSLALNGAVRSAVTPPNPCYIKVVIPQLKF